MGWGSFQWRPYVPVAQRKANAAKQAAKLGKGRTLSPVQPEGRQIATTFWGKAWCDNLESYSDFENRLPRGRTYIRNGSVIDLQISQGRVTSLVSGSELYKIAIQIKPLPKAQWEAIRKECAGGIDSLLELLQGKLSAAVMQVVTRHGAGLFPSPEEIDLDCSCPDWAEMCKHVAATLYGVGTRLDRQPDLLFLLRGVDPAELVSEVSAHEAVRQTTPVEAAAFSDTDLSEVFGIEVGSVPPGAAPAPTPAKAKAKRAGVAPAKQAKTPRKQPQAARKAPVKGRAAVSTPTAAARPKRRSATRKPAKA